MNIPIKLLCNLLNIDTDIRYKSIEDIDSQHLYLLGFILRDKDEGIRSIGVKTLIKRRYWDVIDDKEVVIRLTDILLCCLLDESEKVRGLIERYIEEVPLYLLKVAISSSITDRYRGNLFYTLLLLDVHSVVLKTPLIDIKGVRDRYLKGEIIDKEEIDRLNKVLDSFLNYYA